MPMHPQVQALMEKLAASDFQAIQSLTPQTARAQYLAMVNARAEEPKPMAEVKNRDIPGEQGPIPVRIYRPHEVAGAAPSLVFYHGGGHVFGDLDSHDIVCRNLATLVPCVVISVDYRLAPEHKFPAAALDAYAAYRWIAEHAAGLEIDPGRIAIGGDSAGGNLVAVTSLMARDCDPDGPSPCFQLAVYPVTDYGCDTESYQTYATGFGLLEAESMRWFRNHYLRSEADREDWRAAPLKAESFANLPPACVILAECDVLHDEGAAYANALAGAGVPVELREFEGMIHGFFTLTPVLDGAAEAQEYAAEVLRKAFA